MYQQEYNQNYGQHGSHNQYDGHHGGHNSNLAENNSYAPRIVLDDYNSDLNFVVEPGGVTGSSLHQDGFEYMWAGARATHGVRTGKVKRLIYLERYICVCRIPIKIIAGNSVDFCYFENS